MCCFSKEAQVSATSIFARPAKDYGQYLVYSMTLEAAEELAMILPIPTPNASKEDAVTFINLEKYPNFFVEMDYGFPPPPPRAERADPPKALPLPAPKLKVVEVGSFVASFVPTVKDFARIDERFKLPEGVWDKLPQYKNYGFAVFKLKKGNQKVHPIAFEFPRSDKLKLFIPTVHIHDGKVHANASFDHVLYCQGADTGMKWDESAKPANMFMPGIKEAKNIVDPKGHVYRTRMVGNYKNADIWVG